MEPAESDKTLPKSAENAKAELFEKLSAGPMLQKDLAKYWGLSLPRISQLVSKGMPLDNLQTAENWRKQHRAGNSNSGHEGVSLDEDAPLEVMDSLKGSLAHHRVLTARARRKWELAQRKGVPEEQKLYQIYQAAQLCELKIDNAIKQQEIDERLLMKTEDALRECCKILAEVRNDLTGLGQSICSSCNPDAPGMALKVIDSKVQQYFSKWSKMEEDIKEALEQPVNVKPADLPDEEEPADES